MGKSTISRAMFNSFLYVYQRVYRYIPLKPPFLLVKSMLNPIKPPFFMVKPPFTKSCPSFPHRDHPGPFRVSPGSSAIGHRHRNDSRSPRHIGQVLWTPALAPHGADRLGDLGLQFETLRYSTCILYH